MHYNILQLSHDQILGVVVFTLCEHHTKDCDMYTTPIYGLSAELGMSCGPKKQISRYGRLGGRCGRLLFWPIT